MPMKTVLAAAIAMATAMAAHAATLTYFPTEQTGGQDVNLRVTFDDATGDIVGTVMVEPDASDPDIGDIRGLYFDLTGTSLMAADVAAAITGPDVTAVEPGGTVASSANVNPLGPFDVAIEFGTAGIGANDIQSTTFTINNALLDPDLGLANIGSVAVRVTSIGAPGTGRGGSGKFLDVDGQPNGGGGPGGGPQIPEPISFLLLGTGMTALALVRRRQSP
jgi:hypothetical protein